MRFLRTRQRGLRYEQWNDLPAKLGVACVVLTCLVGCRHAPPADPAAELQGASAELVHGHLPKAVAMASAGHARYLHKDPQLSFRFCLAQADALSWQGRSQEVVDVLRACDASYTPAGDMLTKQHLLLSLALSRVGNMQQSNAELEAAQHSSPAASPQMQGEIWRTTGLLQNRSGHREEGITSLQKSLAIAREQKDKFLEAADLSNLGTIAEQMEHTDEALNWFNASAKVAEQIHSAVVAQSDLGNAGWAYYTLGDFERALASFQQAETQAANLGSSDNEILWLQSAGLCLSRMGDLRGARAKYEEALSRSQQAGNVPRTVETQTSLGLLFVQLAQYDSAKTYADESLRGAKAIGDVPSEMDATLLQALVAAHDPSAQDADKTLLSAYNATEKLPSLRWQIENAFAEMYASRGNTRQAEQWFQKSIQTFERQRASVVDEENRLPFFANGEALYRSYADFLIANHRSDEAMYLLDRARARTLNESLAGSAAPLQRVKEKPEAGGLRVFEAKQTAAKLNGTILFYSLGPKTSHLWAVSPERIALYPLPPEEDITRHVNSYQTAILRSWDPIQAANVDAQWLYHELVAPAEPLIQERASVFVIRNGKLNSLNFETLLKPGPQGLHYWIEDARITNASSISSLARSAQPASSRVPLNRGAKLLLIGDPVPASSEYPALANAQAEIHGIASYFPEARRAVFTQAQASPAAYEQGHPENYAYIHFVAHGTASTLRPLDSAVILSPPPAQPDAFRLYARDIVRLPLTADLVTISACYGSGVRDYAGEGLVGLSWAFLRAGSRNVIGGLWAVDDASTAQLMNGVYQKLAAGKRPDEALQQAKLTMLHSPGVYRKPFYWAAFQLYS